MTINGEIPGIDYTKAVCGNCWGEAQIDPAFQSAPDGRPAGWGTNRVTSNAGILTDSVLCDGCLSAVKQALKERREQNPVFQKVAEAKAAGEETVKVTQRGTDKEAVINVSEFDEQVDASVAETNAAYAEHEKEIDKLKEEEALPSAPVQVESTAAQDSPPVQSDVPAPKAGTVQSKNAARRGRVAEIKEQTAAAEKATAEARRTAANASDAS